MTHWTIGRRLTVGFSLLILLTVALGTYAIVTMVGVRTRSDAITKDALPGIIAIDEAMLAAVTNDGLVLKELLTQDAAKSAGIESAMKANAAAADIALKQYEAAILTEEDRRLYDAIHEPQTRMRSIRDTVVLPLSREGHEPEALKAYEQQLEPAFHEYMARMNAEIESNQHLSSVYSTDVDSAVGRALWLVPLTVLSVVVFGTAIAFLTTTSTNRVLRQSVADLSIGTANVLAASSQVAASAQELSLGSSEQAASLEESSASMEEMASMTRQNAGHARDASALMYEVDASVHTSNQALAATIAAMADIQKAGQEVSNIIKAIDDIAFQTNVLALNAAVEAARAGTSGMGFAVVADEVRTLAQRSATAAKETATLIEESLDSAARGSVRVNDLSKTMMGITTHVRSVKDLVDQVSAASQQQSTSLDQITTALAQIEKVTQHTAATAEESAAAAEELNSQAEASESVVGRLRALVHSEPGAATDNTVSRSARKTPGQLRRAA